MSPSPEPDGIQLTPAHLMGLRNHLHAQKPGDLTGAQSLGGRVVNRAGQGQEIFDLRPFEDGDDMRLLDHRATARKGRPHIKRLHMEQNVKLTLVLDLRPCMFFGIRRALAGFAAAELLALEGWAHLQRAGQIGLYAFTNSRSIHLRPRPREHAMLRIIGEICGLYEAGMKEAAGGAASASLDARLSAMTRLGERGAMVLVASSFDAPGAGIDMLLGQMRHRYRLDLRCLAFLELGALPRGSYPVAGETHGRSFLQQFGALALPPFLDQSRGDALVDAGRPPHLGAGP